MVFCEDFQYCYLVQVVLMSTSEDYHMPYFGFKIYCVERVFSGGRFYRQQKHNGSSTVVCEAKYWCIYISDV